MNNRMFEKKKTCMCVSTLGQVCMCVCVCVWKRGGGRCLITNSEFVYVNIVCFAVDCYFFPFLVFCFFSFSFL